MLHTNTLPNSRPNLKPNNTLLYRGTLICFDCFCPLPVIWGLADFRGGRGRTLGGGALNYVVSSTRTERNLGSTKLGAPCERTSCLAACVYTSCCSETRSRQARIAVLRASCKAPELMTAPPCFSRSARTEECMKFKWPRALAAIALSWRASS